MLNYFRSPEDNNPNFIRLVRNLLIFTLVTNLAALLASTVLRDNFNPITFTALTITALLEFVSLILISSRKNVIWGKIIVPWALVIAVTIIAVNEGGLHDITILAYPMIIIIAFLLQGEKAMITVVPAIGVAILFVGVYDMLGYNDDPLAADTNIVDIVIGILLPVATGTISRLLVIRLNESIVGAKANEEAQIEANKELRELQISLEQRVEERTAELAESNRQTQRRANQLEAISDISRSISSLQNIEELLPQITQLISDRFDFYHVGIFLPDEKNEFALLKAANSEGGQRMLARGHKLRIESSSLVGFASIQKMARIALDVGDDAVFFNNPDLPDTHSEIALPMLIGNQIIGVLDVQSTVPNAFSDADIQILSTLANQVAIAIENNRLLNDTREALESAERVYRQYVSEGWKSATRGMSQPGYHLSESGVAPLPRPLSYSEVRTATQKGDIVVVEDKKKSAMAVPIKVRDQVIGVLNVRSQVQGHRWDDEQKALVQAIAERVSLAVENARLLAEAQRRAAKERVIGEISDKISSAGSIENILQTAIKELGTTIAASNMVIQLNKPDEEVVQE